MKFWYKIFVTLIVSFLLGVVLISTALANPPAQDPRPDDGEGSSSTNGGNGGGSSEPDDLSCASLNGQVINWGVGPLGGVSTELKTGSWQIAAISSTDGNYSFGNLGVGVAKLHVTLPPGLEDTLQPLVQDAGVYLNCNTPIFANIALFSDSRINPPATIKMSAPESLTPGENTVIRLVVKNNLPNEITHVVVTNLMPQGLTALNAATASNEENDVHLINAGADGQLVFVNLHNIASGAEENILVTVAVSPELPADTQIKNTATLFYKESAADQDWIDFTVGTGGIQLPAKIPATVTVTSAEVESAATPEPEPTNMPESTTTPVADVTATPSPIPAKDDDEGENFVPPEDLPKTGEDFFPPPDMLPETGQDLFTIPVTLPNTGINSLFPLGGLGLGGLAFLLHFLRASRQNKK